ncbi:MAG TPA: hypothetical protein VFV93_09165 [Thermomicrobiales bacterium]|nr:hypothetical protein [Thermomicrobiales bacterium]
MATDIVVEDRLQKATIVDRDAPVGEFLAPPSTPPAVPGKPGAFFDAVRAFGVAVGPSVVFHALTLGSLPALLSRRVRRPASLGVVALAAYWLALRPWHLRWGATEEEAAGPLPGDEFEPNPAIEMTRAITIDAPVEAVWPWLAQMGQERGGFYSYEWLENLAGCRMRNAESIHPEWQQRQVGEEIKLHPAAGLNISLFEPDRAFGIQHWGTYVLKPCDGGRRTRLLARARVGRGEAIFYALCIEIPHFVMERAVLLGIKERAERA